MINTPKSLGDFQHKSQRIGQIHEPHVERLTKFVHEIRRDRALRNEVPFFDPADGGINAECLFVLEAPGPNAVKSGFVSSNNPDESAKNWLLISRESGLSRKRTIAWNIVPWYLGSGKKIRPAKATDIKEGWPYLLKLLDLLPNLRIIVLVGRKAQKVTSRLQAIRSDLQILNCPHPSPSFMNRKPQNRGILLSALEEVATVLK